MPAGDGTLGRRSEWGTPSGDQGWVTLPDRGSGIAATAGRAEMGDSDKVGDTAWCGGEGGIVSGWGILAGGEGTVPAWGMEARGWGKGHRQPEGQC